MSQQFIDFYTINRDFFQYWQCKPGHFTTDYADVHTERDVHLSECCSRIEKALRLLGKTIPDLALFDTCMPYYYKLNQIIDIGEKLV